MWLATLLMALSALRRNLMRSVLTTLGIVIGVASVIAMVTLGQSATASIRANIASLGTNMLIVMPGADRHGPVAVGAQAFTMEDVRVMRQELAQLSGISATAGKGVLAVFGNNNYSTQAYGVTNEFFAVRNYRLAKGRDFSDQELSGGTPVCILGNTVTQQLFRYQEPIGETLRVGNVACLVIGLIESKGTSAFGPDQDDFLVMPLSTVQRRIVGSTDIATIYLTVTEEAALTRTKLHVEALLRERRHIKPGQRDDFAVQDTREIANTLGTVTGVLTALLGAVAFVSLIVGGIGIMNIMLVSVTERTREIGTRLAIGARAREVLLQFLMESVLLCVLGGAIGAAIGLLGSFVGTRVMKLPFTVNPLIIVVAFVFSAFIGIVFGYLPARRAALLNPIEALRHE